jgi:hypothetical protein
MALACVRSSSSVCSATMRSRTAFTHCATSGAAAVSAACRSCGRAGRRERNSR